MGLLDFLLGDHVGSEPFDQLVIFKKLFCVTTFLESIKLVGNCYSLTELLLLYIEVWLSST